MRENQRNLYSHLVLGHRRLDLLIVESRHAQDLDAVTDGLAFARYDPSTRPPLWCLHFWIYRLFLVTQVPEDARTLVAIAKTLRVKAIISSDAYKTLDEVTEQLPNARCYFIQHGIYLDQRDSDVTWEPGFPDRDSQITLFSIGTHDRTHYRRWGIRPAGVVPTGTLRNSVYTRLNAARETTTYNNYEICIVERGISTKDSDIGRAIRSSWALFLNSFSKYCNKFGPRVVFALSSPVNSSETVDWITKQFPYNFEIADYNESFATYNAVDSSVLTIGQQSTVLVEALSRRKKILSVDFSNLNFLRLPGDGITRLISPTDEALHERINLLLSLDWESYSRQLPAELRDLMTDPSRGIGIINSTIRADLGL